MLFSRVAIDGAVGAHSRLMRFVVASCFLCSCFFVGTSSALAGEVSTRSSQPPNSIQPSEQLVKFHDESYLILVTSRFSLLIDAKTGALLNRTNDTTLDAARADFDDFLGPAPSPVNMDACFGCIVNAQTHTDWNPNLFGSQETSIPDSLAHPIVPPLGRIPSQVWKDYAAASGGMWIGPLTFTQEAAAQIAQEPANNSAKLSFGMIADTIVNDEMQRQRMGAVDPPNDELQLIYNWMVLYARYPPDKDTLDKAGKVRQGIINRQQIKLSLAAHQAHIVQIADNAPGPEQVDWSLEVIKKNAEQGVEDAEINAAKQDVEMREVAKRRTETEAAIADADKKKAEEDAQQQSSSCTAE